MLLLGEERAGNALVYEQTLIEGGDPRVSFHPFLAGFLDYLRSAGYLWVPFISLYVGWEVQQRLNFGIWTEKKGMERT